MSRIVVIGGHGRTGRLVVDQLVAKRHSVIATIRNPRHMAGLVKAGAETVLLDLETSSPRDFAIVFTGADAIVFAAGSGDNEPSSIDRTGVTRTVNAAEKAGVKRYVAISALGATTGVPPEWNIPEMKDYWPAKRAANKKVRESSLDWTIIEPGGLTNGKPKGTITLSTEGFSEKDVRPIPRADVAAAVVAVLDTPESAGKTFQIVGGTTPIASAIRKASR